MPEMLTFRHRVVVQFLGWVGEWLVGGTLFRELAEYLSF